MGKDYCMNCMREVAEGTAICPFCGFDERSAPAEPHQLPHRTILAGRYLVGRAIGEGGFGITYVGWDLRLGTKVALKEYFPNGFVGRTASETLLVSPYSQGKDFFEAGKEKFYAEARRLAKFQRLSGIVSVSDFFTENNTVYIVMEFIEGQTLKQYAAARGGRIAPEELFRIMEPVLTALREVHRSGLIHRDISPDNILVTPDGAGRLIDFGAAREQSGSGERTLSVMLKKGYTPEEQYREHGEQGTWTDVYALSATIYAMLTGVKPDEPFDRMEQETLKRPADYGVALEAWKADALMQGLAIRAKDRLRTVDELYEALYVQNAPGAPSRNAAQEESPTLPVTPAEANAKPKMPAKASAQETGKKKKRPRRAVAILLVVLCPIVILLGVWWYGDIGYSLVGDYKRNQLEHSRFEELSAEEQQTVRNLCDAVIRNGQIYEETGEFPADGMSRVEFLAQCGNLDWSKLDSEESDAVQYEDPDGTTYRVSVNEPWLYQAPNIFVSCEKGNERVVYRMLWSNGKIYSMEIVRNGETVTVP